MLEDHSSFVSEVSADISEGGLFVTTDEPWPPGTVFGFGLRPLRGLPPVRGKAEVVWTRSAEDGGRGRPGMGARFLDLGDAERELIRRLVLFEREEGGSARGEVFAATRESGAPAVTEGGEHADVFPRPGETGVGFFGLQAEWEAELAARRARSRRDRVILLVVAALVIGMAVVGGRHLLRGAGSMQADATGALRPSPMAEAAGDLAPHVEPTTEQPSAAAPAEEAAGGGDANPGVASAVVEVLWNAGAGGTVVEILGNGSFVASQVRFELLEQPPRAVIRLLGIVDPYRWTEIEPQLAGVSAIRIGHHPELDPPTLFVVLDLAGAATTVAAPELHGSRLVVRLPS